MKKLLLISQSARGGLRKHLCELLIHLNKQEFEIWIAYNDDFVDDDFKATISDLSDRIHPVIIKELVREISPKQDWLAYKKLSRLIKEIQPDIVHCHSSKAGVVGRLAAKRNHILKIFYTPHYYSFFSLEFSRLKQRLFILIEKFLSRHATTEIFTVSYGEKEGALAFHLDKAEKFKVIYNGLEKIEHYPSKQEIRQTLDLPEEAFIFGNMARMDHQKNPFLFFELAKKVVETAENIHFVWIGDGEYKTQVQAIISRYSLQKNVHLFDYRADSNILVAGFDAFLSTSVGEGLAYSPIEALRAGVPVFLSNVMGHREIVIPNFNGQLFDLETILEKIDQVTNFVDWARKADREAIIKDSGSKFLVEQMVAEISKEYLD